MFIFFFFKPKGLSCGFLLPAALHLLTDLSLVRFRGLFTITILAMVNIGLLSGISIGWSLSSSVQDAALFYSVPQVVFLLLSLFVPESPVWAARTGTKEDVQRAIHFNRYRP